MSRLIAWVALLCSLACGQLPNVQSDVCGNGVVEGAEECDTYAPSGQVCRPPSDRENACRYDCTGGTAVCPGDAGCGLDGVCRFSTGAYEPYGQFLPIPAQSLQLGDFDGDGRHDLLVLGNANSLWRSHPRILFFDGTGQPRDVYDPRVPISFPTILSFDQSDAALTQRPQIVFDSDFGIGAVEVTSDRAVLPIAYPIEELPQGSSYRVLRLRGTAESYWKESVIIFMSDSGTEPSQFGEIDVESAPIRLAPLTKPVDELVGEPVAANVVNHDGAKLDCDEALFAFQGDRQVYMLDPCDAQAMWKTTTEPPAAVVSLTGNHTVNQTPIATRVDNDAHVDLLLADESEEGMPHMAFGRGDGTFVADPSDPDTTQGWAWPVTVTQGHDCPFAYVEPDEHFPLAVGDLNSDGRPDWVSRTGVQLTQSVSVDSVGKQVNITACVAYVPFVEWSSAKIVDLEPNGSPIHDRLPYVVAGSLSEPGLDVLRATGLDSLNPASIVTSGPTSHLAIGDFDGDGNSDVAFDELSGITSSSNSSSRKLAIAFGNVSGPPGTPVEIGEFAVIDQLLSANYLGADAIEEIGVIATPSDTSGQRLSVFIGSAGRHPFAPLGFGTQAPEDPNRKLLTAIPLAIAGGSIGQSTLPGLVSVAIDDDCSTDDCGYQYRIWLVPGVAQGKLGAPIPSFPLPEEFAPLQLTEVQLAAYVLLGSVDGDGAVDAFTLTTAKDDTNIDLWQISLPPPGSTSWTEPQPVQLLASTPGKLSVASSPKLVDLDGNDRDDLVIIVVDSSGHQQLGVVWNRGDSLPLSQISYVDLGGQQARGFSAVSDSGIVRLIATTDEGTFKIDTSGGADSKLTASPIAGLPGGNSVGMGDMTGDGLMDLAIGTSGGVQLFAEVAKQK